MLGCMRKAAWGGLGVKTAKRSCEVIWGFVENGEVHCFFNFR